MTVSMTVLLLAMTLKTESLFVAVSADEGVERSRRVVSVVDCRGLLVFAVEEDSWGVLNFPAFSVLGHKLTAIFESDINISELDLALLDSLNSLHLLPFDNELLAVAASWVDESNNPNVLLVGFNSLGESLGRKVVRFSPLAVVFVCDCGLVGTVANGSSVTVRAVGSMEATVR